MKILYVCTDLGIMLHEIKGAAVHVRSVVEAFGRQGHSVRLVAAYGNGDLGPAMPISIIPPASFSEALDNGIQPRMTRALRHIWNNVNAAHVVQREISDERPDLVYERYSPFSVAAAAEASQAGIPHLLEVNAPLAWEGQHYRRQALQDAADYLEKAALDLTSLVITVSEELKQQLVEIGVPEGKIGVVPNGVDTGMFDPSGARNRLAPETAFTIGFVGTLRPWHGIEVLIEAFRLLADDPRFRLAIIGQGPLANALEELAEEMPGRVAMLGQVGHEEVADYVRGFDVAVAPYPNIERFYFSPLKLLEYMACGVPIVASDIGQVSSVIANGDTGLLVPPGDTRALAHAIKRLAEDRRLALAMGGRAADEARRFHSWDARISTIVDQVSIAA